jgi:hypothetical protein
MSFSYSTIERWCVYLWGIIFPIQTIWVYRWGVVSDTSSPYLTLGVYASQLIMVFLCGIIVYRRASLRPFVFRDVIRSRLILSSVLALVAFPLYTWVHAFFSLDIDVSIRYAFFLISGYLLVLSTLLSSVRIEEWVRAYLMGSIIPVFNGLYQWFTQTSFASSLLGLSHYSADVSGTSIVASDTVGRWLRAYGTFPHPNIFGGYLVFILALALLGFLYAQRRYERIVLSFVSIVGVFTLSTTFSRAALGAYLLMWCGVLIYAIRYRIRALVIPLVLPFLPLVLFGLLYTDLWHTRMSPVSVSEIRSLHERGEGIAVAWKLHQQSPMFGVGGGMFVEAWYRLDPTLPGYLYQPVHVALLVVLVEYGWVGVALLLISFGMAMYAVRERVSSGWVLFLFGLVPLLWIGLFDHYLFTLYPGILLFFAYLSICAKFSTHSPQSLHK